MSVNYDRSLLADNHRWISYTSYSGTRRYVDLGAVAEVVAKPRGDISIESHDNGDFSVVISNVFQTKTVSSGYLFQSGLKRMVKMISFGTMQLVLTMVTTRLTSV